MAYTTTSTYMLMPVPIVGVDPGPQYATDTNSCLTIIDQHDHTPGSGVQITPSGMSISSDLTFGANNATNLRSVRFSPLTAAPAAAADIGCIYELNGDFYYNNSSGVGVQITNGGSIAGATGSISGLVAPASAAYVAIGTTFVWKATSTTSANMDAGSFILRNLTASSKGLTLSPPAAMGADYGLTLPSLPASQKIMTLDASGTMAAPYTTDGTSIAIVSNVIQLATGGTATANIADGAVTTVKISDRNVTTAKIAIGAVTSNEIAAGGIVQANLAAGSVGTAQIIDRNVTTAKIAIGAVTSNEIAAGGIVQANLAVDSVGTAQIIAANVSTAKIASAAVTYAKLGAGNNTVSGTTTVILQALRASSPTVLVGLAPSSPATASYVQGTGGASSEVSVTVTLTVTPLAGSPSTYIQTYFAGTGPSGIIRIPLTAFTFTAFPSGASTTYAFTTSGTFVNAVAYATEL